VCASCHLEPADELAVEILETVALVHDEELPLEAAQLRKVAQHDLVGGDHHGEAR
jgi:hypothetical protein